jgi:transcriptional regulator with XRE-family HTH domain
MPRQPSSSDEYARRIERHLREFRDAVSMSRMELAQRAGCTDTAIRFWETGQRQIGAAYLARIADALDRPIEEFLQP